MKGDTRRPGTKRNQPAKRPSSRKRTPFEIYASLDLGPGGTSVGRSDDTRNTVRRAILRKHRKRSSEDDQ